MLKNYILQAKNEKLFDKFNKIFLNFIKVISLVKRYPFELFFIILLFIPLAVMLRLLYDNIFDFNVEQGLILQLVRLFFLHPLFLGVFTCITSYFIQGERPKLSDILAKVTFSNFTIISIIYIFFVY